MENASKALIIAGAILLAIAIIGVGMFVFQNVQETITGSADMSSQEIAAYNQTFTAYSGNVRGSRAKVLCDTVNNHNLAAIDDSQKVKLTFNQEINDPQNCPPPEEGDSETTTAAIMNIKNKDIKSGKTYTVSVGVDKNSGLVTVVNISDTK